MNGGVIHSGKNEHSRVRHVAWLINERTGREAFGVFDQFGDVDILVSIHAVCCRRYFVSLSAVVRTYSIISYKISCIFYFIYTFLF